MKCKTCKGKGYLEIEVKNSISEGAKKVQEYCETCDGSGKRAKTKRRSKKEKGFDWSQDY